TRNLMQVPALKYEVRPAGDNITQLKNMKVRRPDPPDTNFGYNTLSKRDLEQRHRFEISVERICTKEFHANEHASYAFNSVLQCSHNRSVARGAEGNSGAECGDAWKHRHRAGWWKTGRGRDGRCQPPPAQIRTCGIPAYGSCLES